VGYVRRDAYLSFDSFASLFASPIVHDPGAFHPFVGDSLSIDVESKAVEESSTNGPTVDREYGSPECRR
jgi:hypothetical protein